MTTIRCLKCDLPGVNQFDGYLYCDEHLPFPKANIAHSMDILLTLRYGVVPGAQKSKQGPTETSAWN